MPVCWRSGISPMKSSLGQHVLRDQDGCEVYGKDGKSPKFMVEWLEEKREVPEYRIWWPESRGAGLGSLGLPTSPDRRMEAMGNMSMDEFRAMHAKQQGAAA